MDKNKEVFFELLCSECGEHLGYSIEVDANSKHLVCDECYLYHQDDES